MSSTRPPHLATTVLLTRDPSPSERARRAARTAARPAARREARRAAPPARTLVLAAVGVTAVSLAGSLLAVAGGLNASWWDAVGPTGRLSVPLPMNIALLVLALAAAGTRRRLALAAAALLALACSAAVVSGFFDGGYSAEMPAVQRLTQVALVTGLTVLALLAGRRVLRLLRG